MDNRKSFAGVGKMPVPWEIYQGDTARIKITVKTKGDPSTPYDLTGAQLACQWRSSATSNDYEQITIENTDLANGEFILAISPEQTATETITSGVFDVQMTNEGQVQTLLRGCIKVMGDVTR